MAAESENGVQNITAFRKTKRRGANIRKRPLDEQGTIAENNADDAAELSQREEKQEQDEDTETITASTSDFRSAKQPRFLGASSSATPARASNTKNSADSRNDSSDNDNQPEAASSVEYHFRKAMDATRTIAYNDPEESKGSKQPQKNQAQSSPEEAGIYKGKSGYTNRAAGTGSRRTGPVKAPSNVRSTSVFDYQPNVCKDYKETGYCGYGDSCIFLHDRGTYKSGWQLEKEFEESQQGVQRDNERLWRTEPSPDNDESGFSSTRKRTKAAGQEELPFACLICRKPFIKPIVTKCQHYFCEACALSHYRKTPKCFACGTATAGVFSRAKELEKKTAKF